ncbi:hypothetical protein MMPV_000422 [Pyropia vietnamensis]
MPPLPPPPSPGGGAGDSAASGVGIDTGRGGSRGGAPRGTFFIARHGERVDHVDPSWPTRADWPEDPDLTPAGLVQARELGERLRGEGVSVVFTSPFLRTIQTAHAVADVLDVPLVVEDGLGEWLNTSWFGDKAPRLRPVASLLATYPRLGIPPPAPYTPAHTSSFPETRAAFYRRAGATARYIMAWAAVTPGVTTVLAVGHGISCEAAIFGLDPGARMKMITYCSLSTLTPSTTPAGPSSTPPTYTATAVADASFLSHPEARGTTQYAPPPLPGAAAAPTPPPSTGEGDYVVVSPADIAAAAGRGGGETEVERG